MWHTFTGLLLRKVPIYGENAPWKHTLNLIGWIQLDSSVDETVSINGIGFLLQVNFCPISGLSNKVTLWITVGDLRRR